jgi:hypothetical protein
MSSHPSFRFCSVFPCTFFSLSFHCNRSTIISINTRNQIFIFIKSWNGQKENILGSIIHHDMNDFNRI